MWSIQYLKRNQEDARANVPPFNYIGVSKLSCSPCHMWIEAFNELGGRQYYTRGCHGKWYWPWGMPAVGGGGGLKGMMVGKISEAFHSDKTTRSLREYVFPLLS